MDGFYEKNNVRKKRWKYGIIKIIIQTKKNYLERIMSPFLSIKCRNWRVTIEFYIVAVTCLLFIEASLVHFQASNS